MRLVLWVAAVLTLLTPAAAGQHGPATPQPAGQADAEAAALHRQFFADPRVYRLADGGTLVVGTFSSPGGQSGLRAFDAATGRVLALTSTALDTLSIGDSERLVLSEHGAALDWRRGEASAGRGVLRPEVRHENVAIRNGAVTLAARFSTAGEGRRPAIVMVHGGGQTDRNMFYYGVLAGYFVEQGFAVLSFDKRAVGASQGGDWRNATMPELASDVVAAVRYLRGRADVDADNVGVWGVSQAGWVGPLAATQTDVAFLALWSAPALDTWSSERNELEDLLSTRTGMTNAQKDAARQAMALMFDSAETGAPSAALSAAVEAIRNEPWFRGLDIDDSASNLAWLRAHRYDPRGALERLRAPVFLAYGAEDLISPFAEYAPVWRERAETAGNADALEIRVYPGANHGLLDADGARSGQLRFSPGVLEATVAWMRASAGLAPAQRADAAGSLEQWRVFNDRFAFADAYTTDGGGFSIFPWRAGGVRLDRAGVMHFLYPSIRSDRELVSVQQDQSFADAALRVRFREDGAVVLAERGRPDIVGRPAGNRMESISYQGAEARQFGFLVTPSTPGPHPAVIFLAGSGMSTRENFLGFAHLFAQHGYAALSIDRRGYGLSGGGANPPLEGTAADAAAAFDFLAARPDINADEIGFLGTSRGGWTAPLAIRMRPRAAFLIVSSGGPVSIGEQEAYARVRAVRDAGYREADQSAAQRVLSDYFEYLRSNGQRRARQASTNFARYHDAPWFALLRLPESDPTVGEWPPARRVFATDLAFDPDPLYRDLNVPTLFLLGEDDQLVPTQELEQDIARMGRRRDWTVRMFASADHGVSISGENGGPRRTAPGYTEAMFEWLRPRFPPSN